MPRFLFTFSCILLFLTAMATGQSLPGANPAVTPAGQNPAANPAGPKPPKLAKGDKPATPSTVPYGPPGPVPERPKTPGEMPPVQPQVSYRDGLLTIEAPNSSLGSVLVAIHNKTGIQFEGVQPGPERVAIHTGPAPVDDVLLDLLHGSRFDYIMMAREDNPNIVERVILTLRSGGGVQPANIGQNRPMQPQVEQDEEGGDPPPMKQETQQGQTVVAQPPLGRNQQQPGVRTPQQMLEDMQRREQLLLQRRQQQQQQKPDDPPL